MGIHGLYLLASCSLQISGFYFNDFLSLGDWGRGGRKREEGGGRTGDSGVTKGG